MTDENQMQLIAHLIAKYLQENLAAAVQQGALRRF